MQSSLTPGSGAARAAVELEPRHVRILGTRGIPAAHGGFETFAEQLALHLVDEGWRVTVYCHLEGDGTNGGSSIADDEWCGIRRVNIAVARPGALGTVIFDWKCVLHAASEPGLVLTLGYNTAVFNALLRLKGHHVILNMDGLEWKRAKWPLPHKAWLYLNERAGCLIGNHLVADHPEIAKHLATRVSKGKITTIPYGAVRIDAADPAVLAGYGLEPDRYFISVARPEPENSIHVLVEAFSRRERGMRLAVLGNLDVNDPYHRHLRQIASDETVFLGAVYEKPMIQALRYFARAYCHGHTVGGTNPSLVEALGAGSAVLAHRNKFNQWVAGPEQLYFSDADECDAQMELLSRGGARLAQARAAARGCFETRFTWAPILRQYEALLTGTAPIHPHLDYTEATWQPLQNPWPRADGMYLADADASGSLRPRGGRRALTGR